MRRRSKIAAGAALASALLFSPVIVGWVTPLTPPSPSEWNKVKPGMTHSEIVALLGPAQTGMFPEKVIEEWHRDGTLGLRKLVVVYGGLPLDQGATRVEEIIWWRPSGRHLQVQRGEE
jgi:hypothetical protein